jgi:hypothetical protein
MIILHQWFKKLKNNHTTLFIINEMNNNSKIKINDGRKCIDSMDRERKC